MNPTKTLFSCGTNMPGYLPDDDFPFVTDDADTAKRYLIDEMVRDGDSAFERGDETLADELSSEAEDLNLSDVTAGYSTTVGNRAYWITPTPSTDVDPDVLAGIE